MIIDRIRAHGGEVIRHEWRFSLRRGRLSDAALMWITDHKYELYSELWAEFDRWFELSCRLEFGEGLSREDADHTAYAAVSAC